MTSTDCSPANAGARQPLLAEHWHRPSLGDRLRQLLQTTGARGANACLLCLLTEPPEARKKPVEEHAAYLKAVYSGSVFPKHRG
jgi:hypothetical protein